MMNVTEIKSPPLELPFSRGLGTGSLQRIVSKLGSIAEGPIA